MSAISASIALRISFSSFSRSASESFLTLTSSASAQRWSSSEKSAWEPVFEVLEPALQRLGQLLGPLVLLALVGVEDLVDLLLELLEVLLARLLVDPGDDRGGEVEHLLELLRSHVDQVADPARDALEEPDVRDRCREVDVAHALAAHLGARHLDAAALADDALVADPLVLAAVALPVLGRAEDALAEQPVLLGLERAVVDRLGLRYLAGAPAPDLLRGGEPDLDCVEVVYVHVGVSPLYVLRCSAVFLGGLLGGLAVALAVAGPGLALGDDLLLALVGGVHRRRRRARRRGRFRAPRRRAGGRPPPPRSPPGPPRRRGWRRAPGSGSPSAGP